MITSNFVPGTDEQSVALQDGYRGVTVRVDYSRPAVSLPAHERRPQYIKTLYQEGKLALVREVMERLGHKITVV